MNVFAFKNVSRHVGLAVTRTKMPFLPAELFVFNNINSNNNIFFIQLERIPCGGRLVVFRKRRPSDSNSRDR